MLRLIVLLGLVLPIACVARASNLQWSSQTAHDLSQAKQLLVQNSPQYLDKEARFSHWLDDGYQRAMQLAKQVVSEAGYNYVLDFYAQGFLDSSIEVQHSDTFDWQFSGVLLTLRHTKYHVSYQEPGVEGLPPMGAALVSCDKRPVSTLLQQSILPYYSMQESEGARYLAAKYFFLDANPLRKLPSECTFTTDQGLFHYYPRWQAVSHSRYQALLAHYRSNHQQSVTAFGDNGLWLRMPSFAFKTAAEEHFYNLMIASARMFQSSSPLVIDLRGNGGGSLDWPTAFMQKLFGRDYYWQQLSSPARWQQFRLSKSNVAYLKQLATVSDSVKESVQQAAASGEQWFPPQAPSKQPQAKPPVAINEYKGRLYVLIDEQCEGACLQVATELGRYPNTVFVGVPTLPYSPYSGSRKVRLDGGATFVFPTKVYRDYAADYGQSIQPKHFYTGDMRDQQALQDWVSQF